jgi:hypothetical protein
MITGNIFYSCWWPGLVCKYLIYEQFLAVNGCGRKGLPVNCSGGQSIDLIFLNYGIYIFK